MEDSKNSLKPILQFLDSLEQRKIFYRLNHIRDSIMVEIAIPGERWEVEFLDDGTIEIEKFISEGSIYDETELKTLFESF